VTQAQQERSEPGGSQTRGRVRAEQSRKRVRALLDGRVVLDTIRPLLVWEGPSFPAYYVPVEDVRAELVETGDTSRSPSRGTAVVLDVRSGDRTAPAAAVRYDDSPIEALRGHVRIDWNAMDEWLEEDEPVYTHPRDPYSRVDILASSRHVEVRVDGVLVADSHQPRILYETGLPPRYYLPMTDVRTDLLRPSGATSHCPYKGTASYWDVVIGEAVHEGLVWGYRTPLPESMKIAGLLAFYDEKVDVTVDGVPQERPRTHF
jgi:uncharacterized protein (DUF427 family)